MDHICQPPAGNFGLVPERPLGRADLGRYKRAVPAWGASLGQKTRLIRPEGQSVTVPTMGDFWLCLLLLLSTQALAQQGSDQDESPTCLLASRFRNFKKYVYRYEAESKNGVDGTANLKNGPKVTCKVDLEVPQACNFIMRTSECSLSEVSVIDAQGQPVYRPAVGSDAFRVAMEKYPLKFAVEQLTEVKLNTDQSEPANILNIKRGIISALMAPVEEEEEENPKYMATLHGLCKTNVDAENRADVTSVFLTRDLSECDHFNPMSDSTSPLALISGMNVPLSKLIRSTQTCSYRFENKRKSMMEATCMEKHIFLPFSHNNTYGITSEIVQSLNLQESSKTNNRYISYDEANWKPLYMEFAEDKAPVQTKDAVLAAMRDLSGLSQTEQGQQRPSLFQKLVSELRGLKNETLGAAVPEMMQVSGSLTWQALAQCGTRECTSAILQILRNSDEEAAPIAVDAAVYALSLIPKPCGCRVRDMLSMAQNRQSKATMFGLSNVVRKLYQNERKVIPVMTDVSEFMASLLTGDCSGDEDKTYLTLRVIGNMGGAMEAANPALKSTLLRCIRQPAASQAVQQAAIQAFRQMTIDEEVSRALLQTYQDDQSPTQKRVAAYLILMKNTEMADLRRLLSTLETEQNEQVKSFVASHVVNILNSEDAKSERTRQRITEALQGNEVFAPVDFSKSSRNYKISPMLASVEGNVLFDSTGYMPKEVMLETTLKAFGYNLDLIEVGMEGNGFEPTIDALFGENGFFPDTASKAMYWAEEKMPSRVNEFIKNWIDPLKNERMKRQVPRNVMNEISRNFNKLLKTLKSQKSPEFMSYLRIMGNELGYIKSSDLDAIARNAAMYSDAILRLMPLEFFKSLVTRTDNELFAHYIFMDNEFALPTAAGFPLKFSLSGIFTPGAKGGLSLRPLTQELSFMPSMGVEFVTQMGIHIPEFVAAGIEMHTNLYHESSLNAKVTVHSDQIKLAIPAPQGTTQLFSVSNRLLSVSTAQTKIMPSMIEDRTDLVECSPLFTGVKYCAVLRYSNASSSDVAPYYPLTGETRLAVELQPSGEVTEYTATLTYELLREGKEGRHKVDAIKMVLSAEGAESTEAVAIAKYNRNKNILTTDIQIPNYDVEAGIRLSVSESNMKGMKTQAVTIDVTNRKIPQLTIVGRSRLDMMKEAMVQFQVTVPALQTDATATATLKRSDGMTLQLETAVKIPETTSLQRMTFKLDENQMEVEMTSKMNSEIQNLIPDLEEYLRKLENFAYEVLDQKVAKTDMKLRHIVSKTIEAGNIWLDKMAVGIPYMKNMRNKRNIPEINFPSLPETLFLTYESSFRYQFNKDRVTVTVPLPLGGKSSKDLNIPPSVTIPEVKDQELEWMPKTIIPIPFFTIPHNYELSVPLLGMAEATAKMTSNYYNWEGSISGGNDTVDTPSYIAKFKVKADSPIEIFSYDTEGIAAISGTVKSLKFSAMTSLKHSLINSQFNLMESVTTQGDRTSATSSSNFRVFSPMGLNTSLLMSAQAANENLDFTINTNIDGTFQLGSLYANTVYIESYVVDIGRKTIKRDSSLNLDSILLGVSNIIKGSYIDGDVSVVSDTNVNHDALKHKGELKYKDGLLTLKSNAVTEALGQELSSNAELKISGEGGIIRVETKAGDAKNRAYSLLSGSVNSQGMEINSDGSITFDVTRGTHKATLMIGSNGLETSGTTTLQLKPLTFENQFHSTVDSSGAVLSITSKGSIHQNRATLQIEGKAGVSEAYLNSVYEGNLFDASSRNIMNMRVNKQGLTMTNNLMASVRKMKTEHTHSLTLNLWRLSLQSKTDNFICDSTSYKHDIKFDMEPFIATVNMNNDLRLMDVEFTNNGLFKVEPYKIDLTGKLRGAFGEDQEVKHTYEIGYGGLEGKLKCSTTGKILGAQMSHNVDLEVVGLSSKFISEARFKSSSLQLNSNLRTLAVPFSFNVDALLNGDGELNLYGKHSGQLYSKFLLKAEPLAFAYSHEHRASSNHMIGGGAPVKTEFDNKVNGLLTPNEQSATWRIKSKLNNYGYSQDLSAYNNAERIGVELSGTMLRGVAGEQQNQECSVSGFLKYDKNGNFHIIELPFIESFPAAFDEFKATILNVLQSVQYYINSLDVNRLAGEFRANLDKLPQQFNNYMQKMDLENKVAETKKQLAALTQKYIITLEDLEDSLENLKVSFAQTLTELQIRIRDFLVMVKEYIGSGAWSDALMQVGNKLRDFDERTGISKSIINAINALEDNIRQFDLNNLKDSSIAWLQDLDAQYDIKFKVQRQVSELKQMLFNFDIMKFIQNLKDYVSSLKVNEYLGQLSFQIPAEEITAIVDSMKDVIVNWIEEYQIVEKINVVYSQVRDLILKYELDKKIKVVMDRGLELFKKYNAQKTLQSIVDTLKSVDFQYLPDKLMQILDKAVEQLEAADFKQLIDKLNEYISVIVEKIQEFDYSAFIDTMNQKINAMTRSLNEHLQAYEIPQKIEATRKFMRHLQTSTVNYLNKLKDTRVAEIVLMVQDIIDATAFSDIKIKLQDYLKDLRERIGSMDIRREIRFYLGRAIESYRNMVSYITSQVNKLIAEIRKLAEHQEILDEIQQAFEQYANTLKALQFEIPSFTVPLTNLVVPHVQINIEKLQEITIPKKISIPEFTILDSYTIPSFTIDFEEIKKVLISFIDNIRNMEITFPSPSDLFGDLKLIYLPDLPDLTFPEITISEIGFPEMTIPKLNLENFNITMLSIPEIKMPRIPSEVEVPAFGKLYSEFKVSCPHYKLQTTAVLQNTTSSSRNPRFTATFASQMESIMDYLAYALDATAQIEAPEMRSLVLSETLKFNHKAFNVDHQGSVTLGATSPQAKAVTKAKVSTEMYTSDIVNNMNVVLESGISASMNTTYKHTLNIPSAEISSQVSFTHKAGATFESGTISLTAGTTGNGKWSILDYTDDGSHKSNLEFTLDINTARLKFTGDTNSKALKMKQIVNAESAIFSYITVDVQVETEAPFIKGSVLSLNGKADVELLEIKLTASHNSELTGRVSGTMSNSIDFVAHPFEVILDTKNKGNGKIILPLKLTGKIDLQNNYFVLLNSNKQSVSWGALARFNQYKYSHNFRVENNEKDIGAYAEMTGEANLDFLTVPLSIPETNVPYTEMRIPQIRRFSLWEDMGLKKLLATTLQSFDMAFRLQYQKNPEMHAFDIDLTPLFSAINENSKILNAQFEQGRDKAIRLLTDSYNQAKTQLEKHKAVRSALPAKTLTIPGYTIPILNIEVSPFTAELPAFRLILPKEITTPNFKVPMMGFSIPSYTLVIPVPELPVLNVPKTLRRLSLPIITLPVTQNTIMIPAMGNITYDFSFKSSVVTLNANAGLYNQSDIVVKFGASSSSIFDILKSKLEGTTSLTRKRGYKLATTLSLENILVQVNYNTIMSLIKRNTEASIMTTAKASLLMLNLELNHELKGNTKTKPNVVSKVSVTYDFGGQDVYGKCSIENSLHLEGLPSAISLETSTKGMINGTIPFGGFIATFNKEGNVYLNANGLRSTINADMDSKVQYETPNVYINMHADMNKNLALEASLRRVYATLTIKGNNNADVRPFSTNGKHSAKATFEFVPLKTLAGSVQIDMSQPSNIGEASVHENIKFIAMPEKQMFSWSGREQLASAVHAGDHLLSNDETEIRLEWTESVEGYLAFLKTIKLPIYQKNLWDVLKFDMTTNEDKLQFLNASSVVIYTKNKEGFLFALPSEVFENGIVFNIPEITLTVPKWVRDIPQNIRDIDMRYDGMNFPEQMSIPPVIIPTFEVPFTTLQIPSFVIDLRTLVIPTVIEIPEFDVNLPGLPKVNVPSISINTEYLKNRMSSLAVKLPKYEITISPFSLPKSMTARLDDIEHQISNFELPSITIPEQKIEIPEITLNFPFGIFIPYFGSLSTTAKVSSPIYNIQWAVELENKAPAFVTSLKSSCTSTMVFLEYELDAIASTQFENGAVSITGKGTLSHKDLRMDWQQAFMQTLRMKQRISRDASASDHTLNVDIASTTFTDVSLRYASRKDSVSASISSPSSGFLGILVQKKTPSQVLGKLYSRYPSAPEKDMDILSMKATLKNSEKLNLQTTWNTQVTYDMLGGLRDRVPAITSSLYKFANKYHNAHFGMDLNRASLKLKNTVSSSIERAYQEIPRNLDTLRNEIENIRDQSKVIYKRAVDSIPAADFQKVSDDLTRFIRQLLRQYQKNVKLMLDAVMKFLSKTKFQLPGIKEKLTGEELFQRASRSIVRVAEQSNQMIYSFIESNADVFISQVNNIEFTVPSTNYVISGRNIVENVKYAMKNMQNNIIYMVRTLENIRLEDILEKLKTFLQLCIQKVDDVVVSLKTQGLDELSASFNSIIAKARNVQFMQTLGAQFEEVKKVAAGYKDQAKMTIQEVYSEVNMERLNTKLQLWIDDVRSNLNAFFNKLIQLLQDVSKSVQPYMRASNRKADIDIPLPFFWRSFSDWPTTS
ncbi:apolipoprotein B-100 [Brienomyrus brachyistius]|uniref:apolipoprotein B-100 n=1 Tax=Brienomyrus brachyistius TaxID=42636 RepID=UPI0020B3FC8E|nr:apolipoprotein B-100 [Brienomyrus brachyistius]